MRLVEQKYSIKLQIVSLILLVSMTIMIQVANYQITRYNDKTLKMILKLIRDSQIRDGYKFNANMYTMFSGMGLEIEKIDTDVLKPEFPDKYFAGLVKELNVGKISKDILLKKLIKYNKTQSKTLLKTNNKLTKEINEREGSFWLLLRNFIFVPFQFLGLVILIIGYTRLVIMISARTKNKNTKLKGHNA